MLGKAVQHSCSAKQISSPFGVWFQPCVCVDKMSVATTAALSWQLVHSHFGISQAFGQVCFDRLIRVSSVNRHILSGKLGLHIICLQHKPDRIHMLLLQGQD